MWQYIAKNIGILTNKEFERIYKPHYNLCDDILKHLEKDVTHEETYFSKNLLNEPVSQREACLNTLEMDGFFKYSTNGKYNLGKEGDKKPLTGSITGTGLFFIRTGGYKNKIKKDHYSKNRDKMQFWFNFFVVIGTLTSAIIGVAQYAKKDEKHLLQVQPVQSQQQKQTTSKKTLDTSKVIPATNPK